MSYWVAVVARNAAQHISATLQSLLNQTVQPTKIIIVNDGSTDKTSEIIAKYMLDHHAVLQLINRPDNGYDIRRVPSNLNLALHLTRNMVSDYLMISGDDCIYPASYAQTIISRMNRAVTIVVASGRPSRMGELRSDERSPSGSGRIVRASFLKKLGSKFPIRAGWEAWLLYKAAEDSYDTKLFNDIAYTHLRPRGAGHQFTYWGAAMHTLGYHPLYAVGRIGRNLKRTSLRPASGLLRGYLTALLGSSDPFMHPFESSLRDFIYQKQSQEITRIVSASLNNLIKHENR